MNPIFFTLFLAALSLSLCGCAPDSQSAAEQNNPASAAAVAEGTPTAPPQAVRFADAHVVGFLQAGQLHFYQVENKQHTVFADERDPIFSFVFDPDGRTLYYTVVRNGGLWLR